MAIELQESKKSRISSAQLAADSCLVGELTLRFSKSMGELLARLSDQMQVPIEDVMTQGVVLLQVAVEAQMRGEQLCILDEDLNVVTDLGGFGIDSSSDDEVEEDQAD